MTDDTLRLPRPEPEGVPPDPPPSDPTGGPQHFPHGFTIHDLTCWIEPPQPRPRIDSFYFNGLDWITVMVGAQDRSVLRINVHKGGGTWRWIAEPGCEIVMRAVDTIMVVNPADDLGNGRLRWVAVGRMPGEEPMMYSSYAAPCSLLAGQPELATRIAEAEIAVAVDDGHRAFHLD